MPSFYIKLAGIPIQVTSLYESTQAFCREYLTDEPAAFSVELTEEDIALEREFGKQQDIRNGNPPQFYPEEYLETVALHRKLAEPLLHWNCLVFHGAAVAVNGQAYLFTAKSGMGKTTHAKLWLKNIENSYILNGDKPLIKIENDSIMVCGTLWRGKENYGVNECLPLKSICILERDTVNHVEQISVMDAFPILYQQSHHCDGCKGMEKTLELLGDIAHGVKLYRLGCNMEDEAALISFKGMSE